MTETGGVRFWQTRRRACAPLRMPVGVSLSAMDPQGSERGTSGGPASTLERIQMDIGELEPGWIVGIHFADNLLYRFDPTAGFVTAIAHDDG